MKTPWSIAARGAAAVLVFLMALPAWPYLLEYTRPAGGGEPQLDRWQFSAFAVQWRLNPAPVGGISGVRLAEVTQASFNTWTGAPNTTVSVSRGADTTANAAASDGLNLICFTCQGDFSQEAETLAVTFTTVSDVAGENNLHGGSSQFVGQILDADILFNPQVQWTTDGGSGQDVQTVATHEIGHFFGIDHTGVVRAILFPFAPDVLRTLSYDDVAAISTLYPKNPPDFARGTISGTVRLNGSAVFGAHVFAESTTGALPLPGNIRKTPIGTLTFPDGTYRISGVPPDSYTVTAEPVDLPMTNRDVSGYPQAFGRAAVQTNFTTRWH